MMAFFVPAKQIFMNNTSLYQAEDGMLRLIDKVNKFKDKVNGLR